MDRTYNLLHAGHFIIGGTERPMHSPRLSLPDAWPRKVRAAMLQVISLARYAAVYTRAWAADSTNQRVRLRAENGRLRQEVALLRDELRVKDSRMARIEPRHRPHYRPVDRMAILELKATRGWSLEQTAKAFLVTAATVAFWMNRLDEAGPNSLVRLPVPVNKFPDFVHYIVGRLKTLCPSMGKVKIAQTLARAGLHLGTTTVGRMLKETPRREPPAAVSESACWGRVVTARYPGHVWHVDLTVAPTGGFWTTWLPFALPQCWPFCYWVAVAEDHFSRRVMGAAVFDEQPSSEAVRTFLGRTIARAGRVPRYLICDRGKQFDCSVFRRWCKRTGIEPPRYGAMGKHGSIAVVERCVLTMKTLLACLLLVPYRRERFRRELAAIVEWYNEYRPHVWLGGRTPNEAYDGRYPANRKPRFEPRAAWPRASPCARPWALVRGKPGASLTLEVTFHLGRKHLPIVRLRRAA